MTTTKTTEKSKKDFSKGLLLWGLVLTGYFIFVFNWVIMNKLMGTTGTGIGNGNGWITQFFSSKPSSVLTQAVNYTITAMRGIGAIGAGFVIAKVGHKYAVIIALSLLSVALPSVFFSHIHNMGGYSLFIIGRMFMAIGGTVLIVYTQPIISRFFNSKQKGIISSVNSVGFNIGAALPLILFMIPPIQDSMLANWEIWAAVVAGMPIILLITYIFVGKEIDITESAKLSAKEQKELKPSTWGSVAKEKATWKISLTYGAWVIFAISAILITPAAFITMHQAKFGAMATWEKLLPIVVFILSLIPALFLVSWVNKHKVDRRYFMAIVSTLSIAFLIAAYAMNAFVDGIAGPTIFMFLAGLGAWGIQGTILLVPHEIKGNSPQRVAIMTGFIWGVGYFMYTISNIILAVVYDGLKDSGIELAGWTQFGIYIGFSLLLPISALFLPKTMKNSVLSIFKRKKA